MARMVMMVLCVVVTCMVMAEPYAYAIITCDLVTKELAPCVPYLTKGGFVPIGCCIGVKALHNTANSAIDRKLTCGCLKLACKAIPGGIKPINAAGLPGKCGVKLPYQISPSTDCSKVM